MRYLVIPALLVLLGCGKDTPSNSGPVPAAPASNPRPAAPATPAAPSTPTPHQTQPLGPSATPPPQATPTDIITLPVEVMITQKQKLALEQQRQCLQQYQAETGEWPKSLEAMWKHYNTAMPAPPGGMRFKYDPQTGDIDLVKE